MLKRRGNRAGDYQCRHDRHCQAKACIKQYGADGGRCTRKIDSADTCPRQYETGKKMRNPRLGHDPRSGHTFPLLPYVFYSRQPSERHAESGISCTFSKLGAETLAQL
jgi:hypothetical protein